MTKIKKKKHETTATSLNDIMRMVKRDNRCAMAALIISILAALMPVIIYAVKKLLTA